jgi:hypothetical protein
VELGCQRECGSRRHSRPGLRRGWALSATGATRASITNVTNVWLVVILGFTECCFPSGLASVSPRTPTTVVGVIYYVTRPLAAPFSNTSDSRPGLPGIFEPSISGWDAIHGANPTCRSPGRLRRLPASHGGRRDPSSRAP